MDAPSSYYGRARVLGNYEALHASNHVRRVGLSQVSRRLCARGIRYVEVIPLFVAEFVRKQSMPAARRLLSDLELTAVLSGGISGLWEPSPGRAKALEDLKKTAVMITELGIDRMVCPCNTGQKYTRDNYKRGVDNIREAGEIARQLRITLTVEFMRGSTFIGTLPTSLRMTREAAHPNVRPMLDCYHFWAGLSKFEDLDLIRTGEVPHCAFSRRAGHAARDAGQWNARYSGRRRIAATAHLE